MIDTEYIGSEFVLPAEHVIMTFGGVRQTAKHIGYQPSAISKWRKSGRVPSSSQSKILQIADGMGLDITASDLINGRKIK